MEISKQSGMDRREFIGSAAAALFAGVAVQILGCGTEEGGSGIPPGAVAGTVGAPIHGHSVYVTKAQLDDGGAVTLDIQGSGGHSHTIDLTAADMNIIQTGGPVTKQSSDGGTGPHNHTVTFN